MSKKQKKKTNMKNNIELSIIGRINQEVKKQIKEKFEIVLVTTPKHLESAETNVKGIKEKKKIYKESISPLKKFLDGLHKKVTAVEKENLFIYDNSILLQQEQIDNYKEKLFEEQQEKERKARELAEKKAKDERKLVEKEARKEAARLKRQATLKEKQGASKKEVNELRAKANELCADAAEFDPGIVLDKVVLEKDRVKKNYTYYINNEMIFIDWALKNDLNLLKITVNKSAFNQWVKKNDNHNHIFIGKKEVLK
jgi:hypothetical protein